MDGGTCFVFDSGGRVQPEALMAALHGRCHPTALESILQRVRVQPVFDPVQLEVELERLSGMASEFSTDVAFLSTLRLIVVDSMGAFMQPLFGSKQNTGHSLMHRCARLLKALATTLQLVVIMTNSAAGAHQDMPALGESWKSVPNIRLLVRDRGVAMAAGRPPRTTHALGDAAPPYLHSLCITKSTRTACAAFVHGA
eukprot:TRINITY_DN17206_c0_g1_i1.p1 TRINITY_DN17206_c0_g1~~TRINITY_DN17206_c0_g1_i1.p1  ORF type:complete len:198 (-),score=41.54 TRINITY_DN17206_c0_g1_i1:61-654(-)